MSYGQGESGFNEEVRRGTGAGTGAGTGRQTDQFGNFKGIADFTLILTPSPFSLVSLH